VSTYKRGNVYWYDFTVASTRYRGSTDQTNKNLANDVEAALRTEAKQNAGLMPRKAPRLRDYIPNFKAWNEDREKAGNLKPATVAYYKQGCVVLEATPLSNMALDRITPEEVEAVEFSGSGSYRNQAVRTLHRLLAFALSKKIIRFVPQFHLCEENRRETVITKEVEDAVVANCSPLIRDALYVMRDTGMRRDEVARMRIEWIDWQHQLIFIPVGKSRNARRKVGMSQRVSDTLFVRCGARTEGYVFPARTKAKAGGHVHPDSLTCGFTRARDLANVSKDVVLYSARHTFGTDVYAKAGPKATAQAMGHSQTRMTERYVHPEHVDMVRQIIDERNRKDGEKEVVTQ
jgi:integrase